MNGVSLNVSETAVHLGHHMLTKERNSFWRSFNLFIFDYGYIYSLKKEFLVNITVITIGRSPLWTLQGDGVESLCCLEKSSEDNLEGESSD